MKRAQPWNETRNENELQTGDGGGVQTWNLGHPFSLIFFVCFLFLQGLGLVLGVSK